MKKLITTTSQITITIISNTTGKNTYAIERTLSNVKGDTAHGRNEAEQNRHHQSFFKVLKRSSKTLSRPTKKRSAYVCTA